MIKNLLVPILFVAFCISFSTFGQVEKRTNTFDLINLERHQFKLNLVGPGLSYELGLIKNVTVATSFGPALAYYEEGYTFGFAWHSFMRYYHNFERRLDMKKNVTGNSADYLAVGRSVFWGPLQIANNIDGPDDFAMAFYGGVCGIQRTYKKGFNFNAEIGVGYYDGDGVASDYGALFNFTFGWVATKRKSRKPTFK